MKKKFVVTNSFLVVALLALVNLTGYAARDEAAPSPLAEVPMSVIYNLPLLELRFANGQQGTFIVDSGFDVNIVDAGFAAQLGLKVEDPEKVLQPGGEIEMGLIKDFAFTLGELEVAGLSAQSAPIAAIGSTLLGHPVNGILGHEFLQRYVVRFDYPEQRFALFPIGTNLANDGFRSVPVRIDEGEVFVQFAIQQEGYSQHTAEIKFDTGSTEAVSFALNFYEDAQLESTAPNYLPTVGVGAGGETDARRFALDNLYFADRKYQDVPAGAVMAAGGTERRAHAGVIGGLVLTRQVLVLDYPRKQILLGPEVVTGTMPRDRSGLWLVATENPHHAMVYQVYANTPAAEAGLQVGDIVTHINGQPAISESLWKSMQLLQQPCGTKLTLQVKHGEENREISLSLRDII
jgi:hypothetical protein